MYSDFFFKIFAGCNICCETFAERVKLPLNFTCPVGTSTCPATLWNKNELHCKDSAQNITWRAGQVKVLFCLPFLAEFTCNLQQGKRLCCTLLWSCLHLCAKIVTNIYCNNLLFKQGSSSTGTMGANAPVFLSCRIAPRLWTTCLNLKLQKCRQGTSLYIIPKRSSYQVSSPVNKSLPFWNYQKSGSWQDHERDFRWVQNGSNLFTEVMTGITISKRLREGVYLSHNLETSDHNMVHSLHFQPHILMWCQLD